MTASSKPRDFVAEMEAIWAPRWTPGPAASEMRALLANLLFEIGDLGDRLAIGSPLRNDCEEWCARIRDVIAPEEGRR